jgi:hypothetical protein
MNVRIKRDGYKDVMIDRSVKSRNEGTTVAEKKERRSTSFGERTSKRGVTYTIKRAVEE